MTRGNWADQHGGDGPAGELSGLVGAVLVLYAERALGSAGVKQVMDRVGADEVVSLVENWEAWVPLELVLAVAVAVAELCHEPDIGRRTGDELFRVLQERGLLVANPALSVAEGLPDIVATLNTATDLRQAAVVECTDGMARIEVVTRPAGRTRFLCRMFASLYSLAPALHQGIGAVVETRCVHRGDPCCEFQVRWRTVVEVNTVQDPWTDRVARLQAWAMSVATDDEHHAPAALEAAALLDEIRHTAMRDPLTGLANRAALALRADEEIARRGTLDGLTILFVDLDGFKAINDTFGHAVGDALLVQLSARLNGAIRASDLVARVGGDEFVVLLADVPSNEAAERLVRKVLAVFNDPYRVEWDMHVLRGSVGVARAPDHGDTFSALIDHADSAMYRVKRARQQSVRATSF